MIEITSTQHPLVKHWVKLLQSKDYRYENQKILIEGKKLVNEVSSLFPLDKLIVSNKNLIPKGIRTDTIFIVSESIMNKISGVQKAEGVMAELPMPAEQNLNNKNYIIVLDRINDPGNMGTLLRTALALDWQGVFIIEGSCDPYNDKALRAAKGATFKIPFRIGSWPQLTSLMSQENWEPYVADLTGINLTLIKKAPKRLLILGNESKGPSLEALSNCTKITIPMNPQMESLNVSVAGAILMYELKK